MAPSGVSGDYDEVVAFYTELGRRPIAAVLPDSPEEALFLARDWVPESHEGHTVFELAGVASARRSLRGTRLAEADVELTGDGSLVTGRVLDDDGRVLATGAAAYRDDWAGFRGIEVEPSERGRGLGLLLMSRLLEWAAERGATTAYLQVLDDNARAFALYDGLGFTVHHTYRYLAAPALAD
jgi:GNAT superfamily N-acetyltransferase